LGKGMQCELLLNRKEMKDLRKIFPKSPANISTDTRKKLDEQLFGTFNISLRVKF